MNCPNGDPECSGDGADPMCCRDCFLDLAELRRNRVTIIADEDLVVGEDETFGTGLGSWDF